MRDGMFGIGIIAGVAMALSGPAVCQAGNNAVNFDGVNDYIQVSGTVALRDTTDKSFTMAAWVKPQDIPPTSCTTNNNTCIYAAVTRPGYHEGLRYTNAKSFAAEIWNSNNTSYRLPSAAFSPGVWHHLCMVVDDVNKKLYFYVDGAQVSGSPKAYAGTLKDYGSTPYYIGVGKPAVSSYKWHFKGAIDEVRIYNRALATAEASAMYGSGKGRYGLPETGLVAGWHLDEDSGTTAADYSGQGNTGSLVNGPTRVPGIVVAPSGDQTPPTGTVTINGGATATSVTTATLTLSATDTGGSVSQMQFSNDGTTYSAAEPYGTTKTWMLSSGDGTKTVYAKFKDAVGNWSGGMTDTITLDTTPPSVSITAPAGGATVTGTVTVSATATDAVGVVGVQFKLDGANLGAEDTTSPYSVSWNTTTAANGSHALTAVARDAAGNQATSSVATVTVNNVAADTTPPTGSVTINGGAAATKNPSVSLALSATDNAGAVAQMQFSNDGTTYSAAEAYGTTKTWTLASGDGTKTVRVKFKDAAGNWSAPVSDTIILDTTPPAITITSPVDGAVLITP